MSFNLNPEIGAGLAKLMGGNAPPNPPVGDVESRRKNFEAFFAVVKEAMPAVPDVETKDFHVKASDGHEILCRWFTKKGASASSPGPAIVYSHGGGMIGFSVPFYTDIIKPYVSMSGVPFLAVDYRLAPEVRAPVPVTDVYAGLEYLHQHASELGVDPDRIGVMGDSAGGGISAALCHYVKQKNGPIKIARQILAYPMLDDRTVEPQPNVAPFAIWSIDDNRTGWEALLGPERRGKPDVPVTDAPGRMTVEDAKGLPPAYIDVGELDVFRDEDLQYARILGQAGVSCELHLIPGANHAFEAFAPTSEVAQLAVGQRIKAILKV